MARHRNFHRSNDGGPLLSEVLSSESEARLPVDGWASHCDRGRMAIRAAASQALNLPLGRPDVMDQPVGGSA